MAESDVLRGDIWLMDWHPARGSEQAGVRPSLILQNNTGNRFAPTTIVAAITSSGRRQPVIVPISGPETGLNRQSFVHAGQVMTIDKSRLLRRLGSASAETVGEVEEAIRISLGLPPFARR